jgi:hypothetical protein
LSLRGTRLKGEWRKLHNEELLTQYCSGNKIEENEMGGACRVYGGEEGRCVNRVLVGTLVNKGPLGRLRRRSEDNIKRNLHEVECRGMDCIEMA